MSGEILTNEQANTLSGVLTVERVNPETGEITTTHYKNALLKGHWQTALKATLATSCTYVLRDAGDVAVHTVNVRRNFHHGFFCFWATIGSERTTRTFNKFEVTIDRQPFAIVPFKNSDGIEEPLVVGSNEVVNLIYRIRLRGKKEVHPISQLVGKETVTGELIFHDEPYVKYMSYSWLESNSSTNTRLLAYDAIGESHFTVNGPKYTYYVNTDRGTINNTLTVKDLRTMTVDIDAKWISRVSNSQLIKADIPIVLSHFPYITVKFDQNFYMTATSNFHLTCSMDLYID